MLKIGEINIEQSKLKRKGVIRLIEKKAVQVKPVIWEPLLQALRRPKDLERIQRIALKGPDNFLSVLAAGSKLMDERIPKSSPEKMTLEEALRMRENRAGLRLTEEEFETMEARERLEQALEIRKNLIPLIEKVLSKGSRWDRKKIVGILLRSMAFLIFAEAAQEGTLIDRIDKKLSSITDLERDLYLTFPEGIWGRIKAYPMTEDRDVMIFKILADLWGNEFPIILTQDPEKTPFASWEDQKNYFNREEVSGILNRVKERRRKVLDKMVEDWETIRNFKSREISPGGWDRILIPEKTRSGKKNPLGKLGINYLRFILDGITPPAVGLEVELKNGKVLLAKINNQGVLLGSWISTFLWVSWFINSYAILLLKKLTVGGDSYLRYRMERKTRGTSASSSKKVKEYLVSQQEIKYRYIPREYLSSTNHWEIQKVGKRRSPILHYVRGHKRDMPEGYKPSPEAVAQLKAAGYELLPSRTWVGDHFRGDEDLGREIPPKPIKDISAAEEIEELLES